VAPAYPPDAAIRGVRGIVLVEVLINELGVVENARVTRSIAGLDEAALIAVRAWEYEPTRVDGKAVKVILTQSITFSMPLPDLSREPGVPELRMGAAPIPPRSAAPPARAEVEITMDSAGQVQEAAVTSGAPPWTDALLRVVRYWQFATPSDSGRTLRISADFSGDSKPGAPVSVALSARRLIEPVAATAPGSSSGSPAASPPEALTSSPATTITTTLANAASPESPRTAAPSPGPADSPTEVLAGRTTIPGPETGISSIPDVALGDGIPDLVRGRRPLLAPMARLGNATGEVVVHFSVDVAGRTNVQTVEGPELLKPAAEGAVQTWVFRRTAVDRIALIATFRFSAERATARVERAPLP
jgi:TonB family protein